jgi:DNA polymerase-4
VAAWNRVIGHVDMDSFYVSVEVRDDPSLRGKPVVVGGSADHRGVVSSASYEARRFGVRSAMPVSTALRHCPDLVILPGNMAKYVDASRRLRAIFDDFSPAVEPLSLDEAFLDLTGTERLLGPPRAIGEAIRRRIREDLSLTGSVGLSVSKFVAKLASDHDKPDGLTIVPPDDVVRFVQSLPLERLWGVGPRTLEALHDAGIRTIAALAAADERLLSRTAGSAAGRLIQLARGEDDRPVITDAPARSLSHEITFGEDEADAGRLEAVLLALCEKVGRRARKAGVAGRTITFRFRRPDFTTLTRSRTFASPVSDVEPLFDAARALFARVRSGDEPVRLIGVGLSNLVEDPQLELDLFGDAGHESGTAGERRRALHELEDAIEGKFGTGVMRRARTLLATSVRDTGSMEGRPRDEGQLPT